MRFFRFAACACVVAGIAFARPAKIDRDLEAADPSATVDVIVQFRNAPTAAHHDRVRERGGRHRGTLPLIGAGVYSIEAGRLGELAADPDVVQISPDRQVRATDFNGKLDYGWMTVTGIAKKGGQLPYDGAGIGVAILDSGLDPIPDLSNIVYRQSFVPGSASVHDDYGHGTHVAGIIAGNGSLSTCSTCVYRIRGIAPKARLVSLRVLNGAGVGTDSAVIAAIARAIALKNTYNIRVMNLSLGRPVYGSYASDPLCQAVERAWKAGIVVVVAAGNEGRNNTFANSGYGTITAPGNDPYVITVGALNTQGTASRADDKIASYSSKGPTLIDHIVKPDLVAPGNAILSNRAYNVGIETVFPGNIVPTTAYDNTSYQPDYFQLSGTSMAAPMAAGTAALVIQQNPNLTPDQVKARLMKTASKSFPASSTAEDPVTHALFTSYYDIFTVGAGSLDAAAALANQDVLAGSAMSPTAVYNPPAGTGSLAFTQGSGLGGASIVWGTTLVWGTNVVYGTTLVWGTTIVWGTSVVWGTNADGTTGFDVVWGSRAVWGANATPSGEAVNIAINGEN
ncbi:MAG: S8 family serine peptidase [Acidobacteria bacterium]|nr:S8 family serine peptidase [Acidobacteriota bacterium]